ncbi:hypothetical protein PORY_000255 [Pneumocystis oryctolagi]|uniref:Uncharacterized protein n=1 Tax=Pneumocystis oryctolagi TaxID=42067 RepID=A0ACB7CHG0_9ASCO|nr:hypothetical protein PORY_000255 [Pneumocystis oryctolagi]
MASKSIEQLEKTVKRDVFVKFFLFSIAVIIIPISNEKTIYAAITAAFAANVVLIGYIVLALIEDRNDRNRGIGGKITTKALNESKKQQLLKDKDILIYLST